MEILGCDCNECVLFILASKRMYPKQGKQSKKGKCLAFLQIRKFEIQKKTVQIFENLMFKNSKFTLDFFSIQNFEFLILIQKLKTSNPL